MTLFILTKNAGDPEEEARLVKIKDWPSAIKLVLEWAGKANCRLAEITEAMAKKLYPQIKIES